jgi:hypothetical protein
MDLKRFSVQRGFLERLAVVILVLCLVGLFFAIYLHMTYGDVLFFEGLLVFAAGACEVGGVANLKREGFSSIFADPDALRVFLEEQRAKQDADGILIMIVGAIIIVISIMVFLL